MENADLDYLMNLMTNMSGLPVRLFQNGKCVSLYSIVPMIVDPVVLDYPEIQKTQGQIGYYIDQDFYYYGIINFPGYQCVIGPSRQTKMTGQELSSFALRLNVPQSQRESFISSMDSLVSMPLFSIIQMLCSLNFALNQTKINPKDILICDEVMKVNPEETKQALKDNHNTLWIEKTILSFVENGDVKGFQEWTKSFPGTHSGKLSDNQTRQMKNTFIVTTTLVSRAAIRGGLSVNESLNLSDLYIQKCELLSDYKEIVSLQMNMIQDYTERVSERKLLDNHSKLYYDVMNYILHHLSESIKVEDMAKAMYLNRSYLSTQFRKTTGKELSRFIYEVKIQEAKKLLLQSEHTIESIADYLGFTTHAHFTRIFHQFVGMTPKEFRNS